MSINESNSLPKILDQISDKFSIEENLELINELVMGFGDEFNSTKFHPRENDIWIDIFYKKSYYRFNYRHYKNLIRGGEFKKKNYKDIIHFMDNILPYSNSIEPVIFIQLKVNPRELLEKGDKILELREAIKSNGFSVSIGIYGLRITDNNLLKDSTILNIEGDIEQNFLRLLGDYINELPNKEGDAEIYIRSSWKEVPDWDNPNDKKYSKELIDSLVDFMRERGINKTDVLKILKDIL
jgi:hypothetical protein